MIYINFDFFISDIYHLSSNNMLIFLRYRIIRNETSMTKFYHSGQ